MHSQSNLRGSLLTLAVPPLLLTLVLYTLQHTSTEIAPIALPKLFSRDDEAQCPVDLKAPNACTLIQEQCEDFDSDGLIPYLRIYACAPNSIKPLLLFFMGLWLIVLFASMATAAGEHLAVHLEFIVRTMNINENLAGVTIFAFGNGCTDVFSTLAAMGANSGSLAISELFGAAAFITTVVLGAIMIIQPFSVDPRALVADVVWFIIAASLLVAFLADGQLVLGECLGIIGLYVAFVAFAILRPHAQAQVANTLSSGTGASAGNSVVDNVTAEDSDDLLMHIDSPGAATSSQPDADLLGLTESNQDSHDVSQDSPFIHSLAVPADNADIGSDAASAEELEDLDLPSMASLLHTESPQPTEAPQWEALLRNFPPVLSWSEQSKGERLLTCFSLPFLLPIGLSTPPCSTAELQDNLDVAPGAANESTILIGRLQQWRQHLYATLAQVRHARFPSKHTLWQSWLLCLQLTLGPQLISAVVVLQNTTRAVGLKLVLGGAIALFGSVCLIVYVLPSTKLLTKPNAYPRGSFAMSILAFSTSLVWIYLTATSAVTLLMTLTLILRIPNALLGATVFAIGQSSNDLVANTAVARRGMSVLAASATFGGPMMNMLLGIGGGGLIQVSKSRASGGSGIYYFRVGPGLFVSAACLILGLCVTLGHTFRNAWRLERGLGVVLIGIWVVFTFANVALNMAT